MSEHYIKKCSCGKVISQCRCTSPDKKVLIEQDGCAECAAKIEQEHHRESGLVRKDLAELGDRICTLNTGAKGLRGGMKCEVKDVDGDGAVMDFIGSDETIDRYNEQIKQDGWILGPFRSNPVIPDCHDYSSIAKILGKARTVSVIDKKLVNRVEFCVDNPMGNLAYKMAKGGFIKSQSVGFIPVEWINGTGKDQPDRIYTKAELLEISLVVVPANPGATIGMALKSGAITKGDISALQDFLMQCGKGTPRVRLERFKAGQKVKLNPESPRLPEFPFCEIGDAVGEVISTYTREGLMDVEFLGDNFNGMLRGVSFAEFILAESRSGEANPGRQAGASATGVHDAQLLQLARSLNTVLRAV